jgi:hypothetical protein
MEYSERHAPCPEGREKRQKSVDMTLSSHEAPESVLRTPPLSQKQLCAMTLMMMRTT